MIITGKARSNGSQLGAYVLAKGANEKVTPLEIKGSAADNAADAVFDFSLQCENTQRGKNGLYHAAISPEVGEDAKFEDADWIKCADVLEAKLGLTGQPRVLVKHEKIGEDGRLRKHLHVVWQREKEGKLIKMSHNYRQHDSARRELEVMHQHKLTRQPSLLKSQMTDLWNKAKDGKTFVSIAKEAGFMVTKSLRRSFTLVDQRGEKMDLARQLYGANKREVDAKMTDVRQSLKWENEVQGWWKERKGRKQEARARRMQEAMQSQNSGEKKNDIVIDGKPIMKDVQENMPQAPTPEPIHEQQRREAFAERAASPKETPLQENAKDVQLTSDEERIERAFSRKRDANDRGHER